MKESDIKCINENIEWFKLKRIRDINNPGVMIGIEYGNKGLSIVVSEYYNRVLVFFYDQQIKDIRDNFSSITEYLTLPHKYYYPGLFNGGKWQHLRKDIALGEY